MSSPTSVISDTWGYFVENIDNISGILFVILCGVGLYSEFLLDASQLSAVFFAISIGFAMFFILDSEVQTIEIRGRKARFSRNISVIYLCVLALTLLFMAIIQFPPRRPFAFFLLLSFLYSITVVETFLSSFKHVQYSVLSKLYITTLFYRVTFHTGVIYSAGDVAVHLMRVKSIVLTSGTSWMPGYRYYPVHHLVWALISIITGKSVIESRLFIPIIASFTPIAIYLLCKVLSDRIIPSLFAAIVGSFFTVLLRVKLQPEIIAFSVLLPLFLYQFYKRSGSTPNFLLKIVLVAVLFLTHAYYSLLAIAWWGLSLVSNLISFEIKWTQKLRFGLVLGTAWAIKLVFYSDEVTSVAWMVGRLVSEGGSPSSLKIQPSFISTEISIVEFVFIHLSELFILSFATFGILILIKLDDSITTDFTITTVLFGILTFIGIFIEGQKNLALSVSFRNAYLIGILLSVLVGFGLVTLYLRTWDIVKNKDINNLVMTLCILLLILSMPIVFSSLASSQSNKLDPLVYGGEVQSPRSVTVEQFKTTSEFLTFTQGGDRIVGDVTSLQPHVYLYGRRFQVFSRTHPNVPMINWTPLYTPSMKELETDYDYLILNQRFEKHGMTFYNKVPGIQHDQSKLESEKLHNNKIWDSGEIRIYQNSSST